MTQIPLNQIPYKASSLSRKIINKLLAKKVEKYTEAILTMRDIPIYMENLEREAIKKNYNLDVPMTDIEFKERAMLELWDQEKDPFNINKKAQEIKDDFVKDYQAYQSYKASLWAIQSNIDRWESDIANIKSLKPTLLQKLINKIKSLLNI